VKAAVYYETGAPDVLRYEDVPDPTVGPRDLLVRVEAISIEGGDTLNRLQGELASVPHVVGYQCAGTVLEIGTDVDGFAPGDRVVTVGLAPTPSCELRTTASHGGSPTGSRPRPPRASRCHSAPRTTACSSSAG